MLPVNDTTQVSAVRKINPRATLIVKKVTDGLCLQYCETCHLSVTPIALCLNNLTAHIFKLSNCFFQYGLQLVF